jgi:hypothetical protein
MLKPTRQWAPAAAIVAVFLAVTGSPALAGETAGLRIEKDAATVSIFDGNRPILRYRYADVPMKPYADQLVSPAGVQVLRDSPNDHKHHHATMYALAVDNVNFWEESESDSGRERHDSLENVRATVDNGVGKAGFVEQLTWLGPAPDKPLLVERRAVDVVQANDLGATLVEWRCRLATPPGKDTAVITGHHYYGLGLRFLTSMDVGGRFLYSDDAPSEVIRGTEQLTPCRWCAFTAKADGKPVTVALFDHPANLRHPAKMFTMTEPFAYLSATLNAHKEPITLKVGTPLELCYGVALWDGQPDKASIEKLYRRWLGICGKHDPTAKSR